MAGRIAGQAGGRNPLNSHPNAHRSAGRYTNAPEIAASLEIVGARAAIRAVQVTRHHTMLLETRVKANASGRPGPRSVTGDYRRSWSSTITSNGFDIEGTVGTNRPQGPRLEFGFVGADRLGRVYNQPPYPHLGPAVAIVGPQFTEGMADIATWGD